MTTINVDNNKVNIHIDNHGNLYFEYADKLYQLNVNETNDPCLDENDYHIINDNMKVLKGKIIQTDKFVNDEYLIEDNGHECVHETVNDSDNYFANNEYYAGYEDDEEEKPFVFYEADREIKISERENGDTNALYDILLYDDSDIENHAKLFFQTKIPNELSIYRMALYISGKFYFRPIGCEVEKKYKLAIIDNAIRIVGN